MNRKSFLRRMARVLKTALFGLLFSLAANAQSIHPKLDSLLRKTLNDQRIALNVKALSAAVQLPDGAVWAGASGISHGTTDADTSMAFGIGSVTKTVTAACILQMADEGLLGLDDPLHQWLDTIKFINPNITIRQLLRHQSGIYDVVTAPSFQNVLFQNQDSIWQLPDVVETFIQPQLFQPGTQFRYSNTNYLLLGMIAEKAGGKTYFDLFRERFLTPLGLESFAMAPFEQSPNPRAHVWLDLNGDGTVDDAHNLLSNWLSFDAATGPAGSYYSTASDLARWVRAFCGGSLHSAGIMAEAKTTVSTTFPNSVKYGLGMMQRNFLGHQAFGHGGDSGFSASAWHFPGKDLGIAVLNNDGRKNSWQLGPVVQALLKTYLDCEIALDAPSEDLKLEISTAPNPFFEKLTLSAKLPPGISDLRLTLSDAFGKTVAQPVFKIPGEGNRVFEIGQLSNLPAGVYFLNAVLDGGLRAGAWTLVKN